MQVCGGGSGGEGDDGAASAAVLLRGPGPRHAPGRPPPQLPVRYGHIPCPELTAVARKHAFRIRAVVARLCSSRTAKVLTAHCLPANIHQNSMCSVLSITGLDIIRVCCR